MEEYLTDTTKYNGMISYYPITAKSLESMSPTNSSTRNLLKIEHFAQQMIEQNKEVIAKAVAALTQIRQ